MKKIKLIMTAAAVACAAIFSGCKKDAIENSLNPMSSHVPEVLGHSGTTANRGIVHYHFETIPQKPDNPLQWSSAAMNAVQLLFNGTYISEPAPMAVALDSPIHLMVGLSGTTNLGYLRPKVGTFRDIEFKVRMGVSGSTNAIVLVGTYNAGGTLYPVRLIVDQDVYLQGQWPAETKILAPSAHEHVALLQMDLSKLTTSADDDLLKEAVASATPGSEIVISSSSNPQLFQHMYQNLLDKEILLVRLN